MVLLLLLGWSALLVLWTFHCVRAVRAVRDCRDFQLRVGPYQIKRAPWAGRLRANSFEQEVKLEIPADHADPTPCRGHEGDGPTGL